MTPKNPSVQTRRVRAFLELLTTCPHVIPANIGAEAFVAEIDKGSKALAELLKQNNEQAPK
jgi:hypothetical protein